MTREDKPRGPHIIFANDLYRTAPTENPLESLEMMVAFDARDWSMNPKDAWIYGVVCGWDEASFADLAPKFGWTDDEVARLKRLNERWNVLNKAEEDGLL